MPGGRPRLRNRRGHIVTARLTAIELSIISSRAAALRLTLSEYLRLAALGFIPYATKPPLAREIHLAVHSTGWVDPALVRAAAASHESMQKRFDRIMRGKKSAWQKYLDTIHDETGDV
jgi:hypothetical protein